MDTEEINKKIKEINTEDLIWIVLIGIIITSFISNEYEKKYYIYNDEKSKNKYQRLNVFISTVLVVIYLYFLKGSIDSLKELKETDDEKKKKLVMLSFIGSLLIVISGIIFLYISLTDDNLAVELAFD